MGRQATFGVTVLMGRRKKTSPDAEIETKDLDETNRNRTEGRNGTSESPGIVASCRDTSECRQKRGTPAYTLRLSLHTLNVITQRADPLLFTQG
jgi:hypothetical protein